VGGPPRQAHPKTIPTGPSGWHTADPLWLGEIGSQMGLGFSRVVVLAPPTSLVFLLNWWDSFAPGEFGAGTVAVASFVSERAYWAGRRPSSSPCDRINCVLGDDSPPGFAVIFSPVGEGWAVGCFPEQFLRQTELIKRSLWLDDEPAWWFSEPPKFMVEQQGIPAVATPVPGSRFPDRWLVRCLRRRGSPSRSVVDYRTATTMAFPPGHPKSDANAAGVLAGTSAVTPAVAVKGESADGLGILFTPPPPLADLEGGAGRRAPPGANAFTSSKAGGSGGIGGSRARSGATFRDEGSGHGAVDVPRVFARRRFPGHRGEPRGLCSRCPTPGFPAKHAEELQQREGAASS